MSEKIDVKNIKLDNPDLKGDSVQSDAVSQDSVQSDVVIFPPEVRSPCDWHIIPGTTTEIYAQHNITQLIFEGSMDDFNKAMRG